MKIIEESPGPLPKPVFEPASVFVPFQRRCPIYNCASLFEIENADDIEFRSHYVGYGDDLSFSISVTCPVCQAPFPIEHVPSEPVSFENVCVSRADRFVRIRDVVSEIPNKVFWDAVVVWRTTFNEDYWDKHPLAGLSNAELCSKKGEYLTNVELRTLIARNDARDVEGSKNDIKEPIPILKENYNDVLNTLRNISEPI